MPADSSRSAQRRAGIKEALPVALGLVPLGLAFGVVITQFGYSWWWAPVFSIVIYAGSMEFLAPQLIASAVGPVSAAVTAVMVNFRHIFYGLSFPRDQITSRSGRAYSTYALTDEAYALAAARPRDADPSARQILSGQASLQCAWVIAGIVGAVFSEAIPTSIEGMEFALTALFVVLAWEAFRAHPDYSLVVIATVCAVVAWAIASEQMLMLGLALYVALVLARYRFPRFDSWAQVGR